MEENLGQATNTPTPNIGSLGASMRKTGLIVPEGATPDEAKRSISEMIAKLIPTDKHVVVVGMITKNGTPGNTALRLASAQRIGANWSFVEALEMQHGSSGQAWSGEVGIVGVF